MLRRGALVGAAALCPTAGIAKRKRSPNEKLNIGVIGVDGRGGANMAACAQSENIVALCDVDETRLQKAAAAHPGAARYIDYRRLLEHPGLDAVLVSTPDHTHAHPSLTAMDLGLHVYCEKPLTHSVWEARQVARMARRKRVVTQMGNQGHSNNGTRTVVEIVQAGVVGPIREAHCWTDRPIWPQGIPRPPEGPPAPSTLHWDLWLGPAPARPYHEAYHPFAWRGWWDFGTGALGDMACHVMDTAYWALSLGAPESVTAESEPVLSESAPKWSVIRYLFPQRGELPPVRLTWYDGGKKPPRELAHGRELPENGTLLIGDRGTIFLPDPYGSSYVLLPEERFRGFEPPDPILPRSPGHHAEWIAACKGGKDAATTPGSHFGYSGPLTEMVLLGNVALRTGEEIRWDARRLRARGCPAAEPYLRRRYRPGWEL